MLITAPHVSHSVRLTVVVRVTVRQAVNGDIINVEWVIRKLDRLNAIVGRVSRARRMPTTQTISLLVVA